MNKLKYYNEIKFIVSDLIFLEILFKIKTNRRTSKWRNFINTILINKINFSDYNNLKPIFARFLKFKK